MVMSNEEAQTHQQRLADVAICAGYNKGSVKGLAESDTSNGV